MATRKPRDFGIFDFETLQINGLSIRVGRRAGDKSVRPLLIFNGIGSNAEVLKPFVAAIKEIPVITFDAPGAGYSQSPLTPRSPLAVARIANQILDHYSLSEVDVLGVSWGGAVAQEFARRYADRCRHLLLAASATGSFSFPANPFAAAKILIPGLLKDPEFMERNACDIYGGVFCHSPELIHEHARRVSAPSALGFFFQQLALYRWTSLHWLHLIKQPTLVMAGRDDPLVPAPNAYLLAKMIRGAQLHQFSCGHLFLVTQPNEVAATIRPFLATSK